MALMPISTAMAQEETVSKKQVLFTAAQQLFRGNEASFALPEDAFIRIEFTADVDTKLNINLLGESELRWPEAISQRWNGIANGGNVELVTDIELDLKIHVDALGLSFSYALWSLEMDWSGEQDFDSILLPGAATESVTVTIDPTDIFAFDEDFAFTIPGLNEPVEVALYGDIKPNSYCTLTGVRITTDGEEFATFDAEAMVDVPPSNQGAMTLQSRWEGDNNCSFGLDLTPGIEICGGAGGIAEGLCADIEYTYPWNIATDEKLIKTKPTDYEHDLPAINMGATVVDFGDVTIGDSVEQEITVNNLGEIVLVGEAVLSGDAVFDVNQPDISSQKGAADKITVIFEPDSAGDFTGTVTVTTNDPVQGEVTIQVAGTGMEAATGDTDDTDGFGQGGQSGCGCSSVSGGGTSGLLVFGLLGLLGLRRRE